MSHLPVTRKNLFLNALDSFMLLFSHSARKEETIKILQKRSNIMTDNNIVILKWCIMAF